MIWRSTLNILTALLRNAFQRGHRCIRLEGDGYYEWEWDCSCGAWSVDHETELRAIQDFSSHINRKKATA